MFYSNVSQGPRGLPGERGRSGPPGAAVSNLIDVNFINVPVYNLCCGITHYL